MKKRLFSILLTAAMVLTMLPGSILPVQADVHDPGDVNGDAAVSALDSMILLRYLAGWNGYAENVDQHAADVDSDGEVTLADGLILLRHLAGWRGYETLPLHIMPGRLVLVTAVNGTSAKVCYTDGTAKTVTVEAEAPTAGKLYKMQESEQGCSFCAVSASGQGDAIIGAQYHASADGDITSEDGKIDGIGTYSIADDAVIFVWCAQQQSAKVITGAQLKNFSLGGGNRMQNTSISGYFTKLIRKQEQVTVAAVCYGADSWNVFDTDGTIDHYAVVASSAAYAAQVGDTTAICYSVWDGSSQLEVRDKNQTDASAAARYTIVRYSYIDTAGEIHDARYFPLSADSFNALQESYGPGKVIAKQGTSVTVNGCKITMNKNNPVFFIDSQNGTFAESGEVCLCTSSYGEWINNVLAYGNGEGQYVLLVDVNNRLAASVDQHRTLSSLPSGVTVMRGTETVSTATDLQRGDVLTITVAEGYTMSTSGIGNTEDTDEPRYETFHDAVAGIYTGVVSDLENLSISTQCLHIHTSTRVIKDATCTATGTMETYCTDCGTGLGTEEIPETDHSYVNGCCKHCSKSQFETPEDPL